MTAIQDAGFYRACEAYFHRHCNDRIRPQNPSSLASSVGSKYVYLRNGRQLLAIYNYKEEVFVNLTKELMRKYSRW